MIVLKFLYRLLWVIINYIILILSRIFYLVLLRKYPYGNKWSLIEVIRFDDKAENKMKAKFVKVKDYLSMKDIETLKDEL